MYEQRADQRGTLPIWLLYVSVNDADDTSSRVTALDGSLVAPPFDVMDAGRMAVIQDSTGATIAMWQPRNTPGARVVNEPGTFSWCELATRDPRRAIDFYCGLFGWGAKESGGGYTEFLVGEHHIGGMLRLEDEGSAPHWLEYFAVTDCDAAVARAEAHGGSIEVPPTTHDHVGRLATLTDPQGARFAVWAGET